MTNQDQAVSFLYNLLDAEEAKAIGTMALDEPMGEVWCYGHDRRAYINRVRSELERLQATIEVREPSLTKYVRFLYENEGKIPAIKAYKNLTNSTLMDSKKAVEEQADNGDWVRFTIPPMQLPTT